MKKRLFLLTATVAMLFTNSMINGQNFIKATRSSAGQVIHLTTDQVLEIRLPRNPSSGYAWCEASSSKTSSVKTIEQSGDWEFVPYDSEPGLVGQPGDQIIRYVGASKGTTSLRLEYKRPWQKDKPAVDEFTVNIASEGKYAGSYAPPKLQATHQQTTSTLTSTSLPTAFSWQSQCTPIKDQGQCGSCWTFAGTGFFEADIKILDGNTRSLSEQCLMNCSPTSGDNGCNGGYCPATYWVSKGAVYESDCPYVAYSCQYSTSTSSATCINSCATYPYHEKPTSGALVPGANSKGIPPVDSIKKYIYNYGPVWIAVDAASTAWDNYAGGILVESGTSTDHAVVLVGWKDTTVTDGSGGYWILRNSWNTDWGIQGYMHISYGSDAVGSNAEYLVYKGIIPHSVAPVAHFAANTTTSCTGVIQFNDLSTFAPTSWSWTFGDGGTSTLQNPSYTYTASGTYTVSLTVTNSYGSNTLTSTNYININLSPTAPTAPNVSRCGTGAVTLNARGGTNSTYYWYDASNNFLNSSPSFTTPSLTATTTYYVEDLNIGNQTSLNASTATPNVYGTCSGYALLFNITNKSSVNPIIVTGISSNFYNAESKTYATKVYYRPSTYVGYETASTGWTQVFTGNASSAEVIPVTNFTIPPGGVYGIYLYVASDGGLYESGANTYSNTDITITTGSRVCSPTAAFTGGTLTAGYSLFGSVYYKTISCVSPLTACQAIINAGATPTATAGNNGPVCKGSSLSLTGGPAGMTSYAWAGPSSFTNATQSPTVSASATTAMAGTYTLTVSTANGCTGSASTVVTVSSPVTASVKITSSPSGSVKSGTNITFTATPTNGGTSPTYQWKKNGTNISGATSSTYKSSTLTNGNIITCVMTSNASCVTGSPATSNSITVQIRAGSTLNDEAESINNLFDQNCCFDLYPNPAAENITIEIPQQQAIIEIFNMQGQIIKTVSLNDNKTILDVSLLPSGLYIVAMKTEDSTVYKKFVKE